MQHLIKFQTLPVQQRLFKSLKLWFFYIDLEESLGSVESTKAVYDKVIALRIANAQVIVNYASFLEENQYWEESYKVCTLELICVATTYIFCTGL